MFDVEIRRTFSAAHQLKGYDGDCRNLHGPNYSVVVNVAAEKLNAIGIALDFKLLKSMLTMKERGVTCFDFMGARLTTEPGSKLEGIQRFKSRFGSSLEEGYMFRFIVNKRRYWIYKNALKLFYWRYGGEFKDIIEVERAKGNY